MERVLFCDLHLIWVTRGVLKSLEGWLCRFEGGLLRRSVSDTGPAQAVSSEPDARSHTDLWRTHVEKEEEAMMNVLSSVRKYGRE